MKTPYLWDHYSDQPYQLKDRAHKKQGRKKELFSLLYTYLSALLLMPFFLLLQIFSRPKKIDTQHFFGMSVNLDKFPDESLEFIEELDVNTLLIRLPLWEMKNFDDFVLFIRRFKGKQILLNIMQDREHVEDLALLQKDLETIFTTLQDDVALFQIGTTINRAKWGFFSVGEYLRFYQIAYQLKQKHYPKIQLLGPSVIDFEYHFTLHALFNFAKLKFDGVSALLYVDRRGAPENSQMGFDLLKKIRLLDTLTIFSPKTVRRLYLTETNWPITQTAPYAPTSEHECVSESDYTAYMLRYYLLAFASQRVESVYWHQLIAPGYGLIDSRDGLRKREAFKAFKVMLQQLQNVQIVRYQQYTEYFSLSVMQAQKEVTVLWSTDTIERVLTATVRYIDYLGHEQTTDHLIITQNPIYIFENNHVL